jgi:hypothetical protein
MGRADAACDALAVDGRLGMAALHKGGEEATECEATATNPVFAALTSRSFCA